MSLRGGKERAERLAPKDCHSSIRCRVARRRSPRRSGAPATAHPFGDLLGTISGWNCTAHADIAEAERLRAHARPRQLDRVRRARGTRTRAWRTRRTRCGSAPKSGSPSASSVSVARTKPRSGSGEGPTCAPAAFARIWPPRHTPSTGTSRARSPRTQLVLAAEPRMLVLLVDVHLTAEDEHGVVLSSGRGGVAARRPSTTRRARGRPRARRRRRAPHAPAGRARCDRSRIRRA